MKNSFIYFILPSFTLDWAFGNGDTAPWKMGVDTYLLPVFHW